MAGRPAKTLRSHVTEGTFRARRDTHRALLCGPPLTWPAFASLQARFIAAGSEPERRDVALQFERLVGVAQREAHKRDRNGAEGADALAAELLTLGKPGSVAQLLKFFPEPNQPGTQGTNNYFSTNPRSDTFYSISTRVDHRLTSRLLEEISRCPGDDRREERLVVGV